MPADVAGTLERLVLARDRARRQHEVVARRAALATNRIGLLRSMQMLNAIHDVAARLAREVVPLTVT